MIKVLEGYRVFSRYPSFFIRLSLNATASFGNQIILLSGIIAKGCVNYTIITGGGNADASDKVIVSALILYGCYAGVVESHGFDFPKRDREIDLLKRRTVLERISAYLAYILGHFEAAERGAGPAGRAAG